MRAIMSGLRTLGLTLKLLWVFFPAILLIVLTALASSQLVQGRDIILVALESGSRGFFLLIGMMYWATVSWYSSRLIAYNKDDIFLRFPKGVYHAPRLIGYSCFSVILYAFLHLEQMHIGESLALAAIATNISLYFILHRIFIYLRDINPVRFLQQVRLGVWIALMFACIACSIIHQAWIYILCIPLIQAACLFLVVVRRKIQKQSDSKHELRGAAGSFVYRMLAWVLTDQHAKGPRIRNEESIQGEIPIFRWFNAISILSILIYLSAIFILPVARSISTFPIILIALGVQVGFANLVSLLSVKAQTNFHFIFITLVFLIGLFTEPHHVRMSMPSDPSAGNRYAYRPGLHEYFREWVEQRRDEIADTSRGEYSVYMALADGGASRSGYWTAGVLSRIEQETKGRFSKQLFCLSGASGGSLGNAVFYASLKTDSSEYAYKNHLENCRSYLSQDFLSYTMARLLGPDFFKPIFPFSSINDRAAALEYSLESVPGNEAMADKMEEPFSNVCFPASNDGPALFLNTTRMQDGRPGVVSTIQLDTEVFGKRIDVLSTLSSHEDVRMSSMVVLGARFPYISPAGRIHDNYFVDGGYFDNSGAGVVFDIIMELQHIIADSLRNNPGHYLGKLRFRVIHARNSTYGERPVGKVHPMINDLAAPINTLLGAYSTQTDVNNLRLKKFLESNSGHQDAYINIGLYKEGEEERFPMNWVISKKNLLEMDARLQTHEDIARIVASIKQENQDD